MVINESILFTHTESGTPLDINFSNIDREFSIRAATLTNYNNLIGIEASTLNDS